MRRSIQSYLPRPSMRRSLSAAVITGNLFEVGADRERLIDGRADRIECCVALIRIARNKVYRS